MYIYNGLSCWSYLIVISILWSGREIHFLWFSGNGQNRYHKNKLRIICASKRPEVMLIYIYSVVGDRSRGQPEGALFNTYYPEVLGRALLHSMDCSTLPLIRTLYCWVLSKEVSSTIYKVFGMTRPGIELRSPGPLANTLLTRSMSNIYISQLWIKY